MARGDPARFVRFRAGGGGGGAAFAPLPPWAVWALTGAAALLGLACGWAAFRLSPAVHFRFSATHLLTFGGVLAAGAVVVRWRVLGLAALVLLVYLHLSDVLIRHHDIPSLLQLLAVPLLLAALLEWRGDLFGGLAPWLLTLALLSYVVVHGVSTVVARDAALAEGRVVAVTKGFVIYLLVLLLAAEPKRVRAGAWALVGGGFLLAVISLAQVAGGDFGSDVGGLARIRYVPVYGDVVEPRVAGPLGDPNFFAQILVLVVPVALLLAWKERTRWLRGAALVAALAATATTVFTYSRGGALALGVVWACSIFAARPSRKRVAVALLLLVGGTILIPTDFTRRLSTLAQLLPGEERVREMDSSFQNRVLQARVAWRIFVDRPALGVGAGNYTVHYYDYADQIGSAAPEYDRAGGAHYPHNLYLELASETGFAGLIAFGGALLFVFGYLRRAQAAYLATNQELYAALAVAFQIALAGYLLSSLFLHGHFQRYLWLVLGLSAALARAAPPTGLLEEAGEGGWER